MLAEYGSGVRILLPDISPANDPDVAAAGLLRRKRRGDMDRVIFWVVCTSVQVHVH